ncbi:3-hydroxyacyl-[acyl-carrier-protein] dehydratase [Sulfuritortus calidifontis]|uniref:3-hydroxyacyl-[acyl-carrier-protein] dehydratase FabZ n=2 Tax=Sulfuritortus calidifontis TaxID=1914471 RepID=A0A4R3JU05_9PROT|nr:3-hydroxyacyl-[acyl-carrier-protein] dehydratase [Sulfuritortus calidifontis]
MSTEASSGPAMDIKGIMRHLPHRYPFLLVDRVLEIHKGERIVALKNVTMNEPFFPGHFPHHPVMPGVLIIEALAQAAGILAFQSADMPVTENTVVYFVGIDNARFKKPVTPGDQLRMEVAITKNMRGIWKFTAQALVDGQLACEAELMCTLRTVE